MDKIINARDCYIDLNEVLIASDMDLTPGDYAVAGYR